MRRQNLLVLVSVALALLAVLAFGTGCKNQFLEKPSFGNPEASTENNQTTNGAAVSFGAPAGLTSTQGGYREITLSWDSVKDAVRYNVYRASTQFDTFVQVGETAGEETTYTMKVASGADYYYRVTAVSHSGEQSPFSSIVRGTSLATPLISAIEGVEGKEDSDVTVYWYMGNVDAYQNQVRYNVICYDAKGTELARVVVDGSKSPKTEAVIPNLTPNTDYQYKIEAFLVTAQDKVEAGDPMDAATARRLRPNAPEELKVEQGQSKDGITLSFKLPALVDVALPGGLYEQYPLYFKIYRREYAEGSTDTEKGWTLLKADFGKTDTKPGEGETQKVKFGSDDEDYTPGKVVSWTDGNKLNRGVRYEYKVQSFAYYERDITSKYSASIATGWLVAKADFGTGEYTPVLNEEQTANVSSTLGFRFAWDTLGLDDEYHFILTETRFNLEGDAEDKTTSEEKETQDKKFTTIAEVQQYVRHFNNLNTADVRGYYKYTLAIFNKNGTEILSLQSPGRAIVTDSVDVPVIKLFSVTSGYNDKIELQWKHNSAYKYTVEYTGDAEGEQAQTIDQETLYASKFADYKDGDTVTYTHTVGAGKKHEYILRVSETISTDSLPIVGRTSVAPSLAKKDYSYDALTVEWQDVPAESFTLEARYKDGTTASRYPIDPQELDGNDADTLDKEPIQRTVTFDKPNGYTHATVSGKPVEITITAKVPVTRTVHILQGETGSSYDITTETLNSIELKTTIEHYTMGPAMVAAKADLGVSSDKIQLTWKKVEGAAAYVVIRNGFHISSKAGSVASDSATHLDFKSTDMYLVKTTGSDTWTVEHKPSNQVIEKYFSVAVADDTFTLTDNLYTDADSTSNVVQTMGQWIARQKEISWGAPYKYTVLPVLTHGDVPEYDYEVSPALATLESASLSLTDLPLVNGATKGYAWNVKATKGTYSENGENTGVKLTWTRPWAMPTENYMVYRANSSVSYSQDGAGWETLSSPVEKNATEFVDKTAQPGIMYQYMIAPASSNPNEHPYKNAAYKEFFDGSGDEKYTDERLANGFMLPQIEFDASRKNLDYDKAIGGKISLTWHAPETADKTNYLFEGYEIEVLNNNLDGEWQTYTTLKFGDNEPKKASYTYKADNATGLLKVLRDYKLYFRIRTFTTDDNGDKVFSKLPIYEWEDGKETDYVKWGARQLTLEEFAKIALTSIVEPIETVRCSGLGSWDDGDERKSSDGNFVTSGWYWWWTAEMVFQTWYNDYTANPVTKSGRRASGMKLNGQLNGRGGATGAFPYRWWTATDVKSNNITSITVTYPALNTQGTISLTGGWQGTYSWEASYGISRSAGTIQVRYNNESWDYNSTSELVTRLPLPLNGDGDFSKQYNTDYWK